MFRQIKVLSYPVLLTMVMASGSAMGDSFGEKLTRERIYSDAASQAAQEGQRFYNDGQTDQLRHRVDNPDQPKYQYQHQTQQDKQSQHRYNYQEKSGGQHMHQSGSPGKGSGGGMGGGRGR